MLAVAVVVALLVPVALAVPVAVALVQQLLAELLEP
jgi:hypothetical protein